MSKSSAREKIIMSRWDSLRDKHKTPRISLANPNIKVAASTIDPMFQGSNMPVLDETIYTRIEFARQLALRGNFRTDLDGEPRGDNAAFVQLCRKLTTHIGSTQTLNSLQIIKLANELDEHVRAAIYLCDLADQALTDAIEGLSHNNESRKAMIVALAKAVGSVCAIAIPPPAGPLLGTIVVSVFSANSYTDMAGNLVGGILDAKTGAKKDTDVKIKGDKKLTATSAGTDATVGDGMGDKGGDIFKACITLLQDAGGMSETIKNSKVKTPLTYLSQRGSPPSETLEDFKDLKTSIEQMMKDSVQLIFADLQGLANETTYSPKALAKALIDYESKVSSGTNNLFLKNIVYATEEMKLEGDTHFTHHGQPTAPTPPPALQLNSVPTAESRFFGFINNSAEVRAVEEANRIRREAHDRALLTHANETRAFESQRQLFEQNAQRTIVSVRNHAIIETSAVQLSDAAKWFINTRAAKMLSTIFARTGAIDTQRLQSRENEILKEFQIACVAAHFENIKATTSFNQARIRGYSTDDRFRELKDSVKHAAKDPANPQRYLMVAENFGGRTGRYLEQIGLISRKPSTRENTIAGKNYAVSNLNTGPIPPIPYHSDKGKHSRVIMRAFAVEYTRVSHERLTKVIMG